MAREFVTTEVLRVRDEATGQWNKFVNEAERGAGKIHRQFDKLRGVISGVFSVYMVKNFIEQSNKADIATANLTNALRLAGVTNPAVQKQMQAYSDKLQGVTMYSHDVIDATQALLVQTTGLSGKAVQPLTLATLNMASAFHLQADQVAILVGKTFQGQQALSRYGISTKGATSQQDKLNMMLTQMNRLFGGEAFAQGATAAGRLKEFGNAAKEAEEKIGDMVKKILGAFLPTIQKVIEAFTNAPTAIQATVLAMGALLVAFNAFGVSLTPMSLGIVAIVGGLILLGSEMSKLTRSAMDEANSFTAQSSAVTKLTGDVKLLTAAQRAQELQKLQNEYADLTERIYAQGRSVNYVGTVIGSLGRMITGTYGMVGPKVVHSLNEQGKAWAQQRANIAAAEQSLQPYVAADISAATASKFTAGSLAYLNDEISKQKKALGGLAPSSEAYIAALAKIDVEQARLNSTLAQSKEKAKELANQIAMMSSLRKHPWTAGGLHEAIPAMVAHGAAMTKMAGEHNAALASLPTYGQTALPSMFGHASQALISQWGTLAVSTIRSVGNELGAAFSGKQNVAKAVLKQIGNMLIDMAEAALFSASAVSAAHSVMTFGATLIKEGPEVVAGFAALEVARGFLNSFHQGGSFYVNAPPSTTVPILVRGGERGIIQTESQQRSNPNPTGAKGDIHIHIHGPVYDLVSTMREGLAAVEKHTGQRIADISYNSKSVANIG